MDSEGLWYGVAGTPLAPPRPRGVRRYFMDERGRRRTTFHPPVAGTGNLSRPGQRHTK